MTARIEPAGAGAAPNAEEVAAIAAALQATAAPPPSPPAATLGARWRRAGREYGGDMQR